MRAGFSFKLIRILFWPVRFRFGVCSIFLSVCLPPSVIVACEVCTHHHNSAKKIAAPETGADDFFTPTHRGASIVVSRLELAEVAVSCSVKFRLIVAFLLCVLNARAADVRLSLFSFYFDLWSINSRMPALS